MYSCGWTPRSALALNPIEAFETTSRGNHDFHTSSLPDALHPGERSRPDLDRRAALFSRRLLFSKKVLSQARRQGGSYPPPGLSEAA